MLDSLDLDLISLENIKSKASWMFYERTPGQYFTLMAVFTLK